MSRSVVLSLLCVPLMFVPVTTRAAVITFDDLADSVIVGGAYAGVTFTNATALTAGVSLNEFEFPPSSGGTVAFDADGPMRVDFALPVASVGGFFTYLTPVTLRAFSATDALLGSAFSAYSSNLALSGDAGSLPNEFLGLAVGGIAYVVIAGDPAGSSFALDDLTFEVATQQVPEPAALGLLLLGLCSALARGNSV